MYFDYAYGHVFIYKKSSSVNCDVDITPQGVVVLRKRGVVNSTSGTWFRNLNMKEYLKDFPNPTEEEFILLEMETGYDLRKPWELWKSKLKEQLESSIKERYNFTGDI